MWTTHMWHKLIDTLHTLNMPNQFHSIFFIYVSIYVRPSWANFFMMTRSTDWTMFKWNCMLWFAYVVFWLLFHCIETKKNCLSAFRDFFLFNWRSLLRAPLNRLFSTLSTSIPFAFLWRKKYKRLQHSFFIRL